MELTPRSAVTEKVPSAIKLTDGRYVPVGNKSVPPPPPPVSTGNGAGDMSPPPGNFKNKSANRKRGTARKGEG